MSPVKAIGGLGTAALPHPTKHGPRSTTFNQSTLSAIGRLCVAGNRAGPDSRNTSRTRSGISGGARWRTASSAFLHRRCQQKLRTETGLRRRAEPATTCTSPYCRLDFCAPHRTRRIISGTARRGRSSALTWALALWEMKSSAYINAFVKNVQNLHI